METKNKDSFIDALALVVAELIGLALQVGVLVGFVYLVLKVLF